MPDRYNNITFSMLLTREYTKSLTRPIVSYRLSIGLANALLKFEKIKVTLNFKFPSMAIIILFFFS